jgi:proteasome lid subunit RPN8/RPN11
MGMGMRTSRALIDELVARAAASPDREICGLLLGTETEILGSVPTRNMSANPEKAFEIDPQALFDQARGERAGGMAMIGHYHSHPNGRAEPSRCDAAAAVGTPSKLWLILAGGSVTLWRSTGSAEPDRGFERVDLVA